MSAASRFVLGQPVLDDDDLRGCADTAISGGHVSLTMSNRIAIGIDVVRSAGTTDKRLVGGQEENRVVIPE